MNLWLVSLDPALPTLQAYLDARGDKSLDPVEVQVAADLLERCVKTSELLVEYALRVAGRPQRE
jgi:hypothetical protein